jgi:hypothetical protein
MQLPLRCASASISSSPFAPQSSLPHALSCTSSASMPSGTRTAVFCSPWAPSLPFKSSSPASAVASIAVSPVQQLHRDLGSHQQPTGTAVPLEEGQGCIAGPKANWVGIYWLSATLLYATSVRHSPSD